MDQMGEPSGGYDIVDYLKYNPSKLPTWKRRERKATGSESEAVQESGGESRWNPGGSVRWNPP